MPVETFCQVFDCRICILLEILQFGFQLVVAN